jgi:hypothetical protein
MIADVIAVADTDIVRIMLRAYMTLEKLKEFIVEIDLFSIRRLCQLKKKTVGIII